MAVGLDMDGGVEALDAVRRHGQSRSKGVEALSGAMLGSSVGGVGCDEDK